MEGSSFLWEKDEAWALYQTILCLNKTYRRYALSILQGLRFAQEQALDDSKQRSEEEKVMRFMLRQESANAFILSLDRITDPHRLADCVRDVANIDVQMAAIDRINDDGVLGRCVRETADMQVKSYAIARIRDIGVLSMLLNQTADMKLRSQIRERAGDLHYKKYKTTT